jgi:hypothetical protein
MTTTLHIEIGEAQTCIFANNILVAMNYTSSDQKYTIESAWSYCKRIYPDITKQDIADLYN